MTLAQPRYAWLASSLLDPSAWIVELEDEAREALIDIAQNGDGPRRLRCLATTVAKIRAHLAGPLGFVMVKGFPINLSERQLERAYVTLGRCLGRPVSQTTRGELLTRVEDAGVDIGIPTNRGHKSAVALPFHVDRTDVVGLLCIRAATEGGTSRLASAHAVHEMLARRDPALLEVLYEPFPHDRRGEQPSGEPSWLALPVFADVDGCLISRYVRRFIEGSQRFPDAPRLLPGQTLALDTVDAILDEPGVALEMDLLPGDLQLIDNHRVWHSRTRFSDPPDGPGRLLLRLWLATPDSQPLPRSFLALYGATAAGSVRGGVWPPDSPPMDLAQPVRTALPDEAGKNDLTI